MATQSRPMPAAALREAERVTMLHTPEADLMDRAAAAIAREIDPAGPVVLLVGRGNNGGDALLAGALLARAGTRVTAVLVAPDAHARGLRELAEAGGEAVAWTQSTEQAAVRIATARTVVDGIVGLGSRGGLRDDAAAAVALISPSATVVAVDLPSGLDPDSGAADAPHVRADITVTFTAPKECLVREPAAASAGRVVIADVGVDL